MDHRTVASFEGLEGYELNVRFLDKERDKEYLILICLWPVVKKKNGVGRPSLIVKAPLVLEEEEEGKRVEGAIDVLRVLAFKEFKNFPPGCSEMARSVTALKKHFFTYKVLLGIYMLYNDLREFERVLRSVCTQ